MDWTQVLTVFVIVATNLITVITLYIHSDSKVAVFLKGIQDEMKDFHGKLERQDAEFKARAEKIDAEFRARAEKIDIESRARTEKLDAEFKMHLMYEHTKKLEA
jgi:acylphosphatase